MEKRELYEILKYDINNVVNDILENFPEHEKINGNTFLLTHYGHKFGLEIDIYFNRATIKTYYLQRDSKVFEQYNKVETIISEANIIYSTINNEGKTEFSLGGSGTKYITRQFRETHSKKYYKAICDFIGK